MRTYYAWGHRTSVSTMKTTSSFLLGFLLASVLFGSAWHVMNKAGLPRIFPDQIAFDSSLWKSGDAALRGRMYKDLVRHLESERPSQGMIIELLGPSGFTEPARLNGAEYFYVYHIDLGQRIAGKPFLHKLGIAFTEDGAYSHAVTWD